MKDIDIIFQDFQKPDTFSRVDSEHPLDLFLGLDSKGRRALKYRGQFSPVIIKGTGSIEVTQFRRTDFNTLVFSLINPDMTGLFSIFCCDIIDTTRSVIDCSSGYYMLLNRFHSWKKMFSYGSVPLLTESEVIGLLGELLFLRDDLFTSRSHGEALLAWSGSEMTHKDFSFDETWYEVKTILSKSSTVKISSLEQLESSTEGNLVLYSMEKMSPAFSGLKLNSVIMGIKKTLVNQDDLDLFEQKLISAGYRYSDSYDQFCFVVIGKRKYKVDPSFPQISKLQLHPAIIKASYEILISEIDGFLVRENE